MSIIASSSDDLKLHQWADGALQQTYYPASGNDGSVRSISWAKDGNWIVLVPHSTPVEIISTKGNAKLLHAVQDIYNPTCAAFQNNTKRNIAVGTLTGQVLVYDIKARGVTKRFPRGSSKIFSLTYNAKDTHIAAGCTNGNIMLFNNTTSHISCCYKVPKSETVSVINFHRTTRSLLAAGSEEGIVATWNINTNVVQFNVAAHQAPVTDVAFSPLRPDILVTSGLDRRFCFYDLLANKRVAEVEVGNSIKCLDFSYCGIYLALGSQNGNIALYDTRNLSMSISAFVGHEGKEIRHLLFQRIPTNDERNGSTLELTSEDFPQQPKPPSTKQKTDSLGLVVCEDSSLPIDVEPGRKLSVQFEDSSFLVAVGLNNDTSSEHSAEQDSYIIEEPTKDAATLVNIPKHPSFQKTTFMNPSESTTPVFGIKQASSTPKYLIAELPVSTVSPIVTGNGDILMKSGSPLNWANMMPEDLKRSVKDIVKQELESLKEEMRNEFVELRADIKQETTTFRNQVNMLPEDLKMKDAKQELAAYKEEISNAFSELYMKIRQESLDTQWSLARYFVDIQEQLDKSNNATVREFISDEFLISENDRLLRELESLKQQMAEMHSKHSS